MRSSWYRGINRQSEEARAERNAVILAANNAFKILISILDDRLRAKEKERDSSEMLAKPDYGMVQAYISGYKKALEDVKDLVNLTIKE